MWEVREGKKGKEYTKESAKEKKKAEEVEREGRKLKEFLEDYDDERDDPKFYKGREMQRRLQDRSLLLILIICNILIILLTINILIFLLINILIFLLTINILNFLLDSLLIVAHNPPAVIPPSQGAGGREGRRGQEAGAGRDLGAQVSDLLRPQALRPGHGVPAAPPGAGAAVPA